ncbi:MAG: NTP transferase domain-containing protein [Jatrophihabitans sp.]
MRPQVVILAAGSGTRLGRPHPKPLTPLADGRTIMLQQLDNIAAAMPDAQTYVVVGFKLEMILEAHPENVFVYNEVFDQTNTSKSLLRALKATADGGVLWMNGDVVFDAAVLEAARPMLAADTSFVVVNDAVVGAEEVKYTLGPDGSIADLSKTVIDGLGEAIGVNYISSVDKAALIRRLDEVDDQDYFERAMELLIAKDHVQFAPLVVPELGAIEVDTQADLDRANHHLRQTNTRAHPGDWAARA